MPGGGGGGGEAFGMDFGGGGLGSGLAGGIEEREEPEGGVAAEPRTV